MYLKSVANGKSCFSEMKILHVIIGFGKAAGTSVFCGELCNELARNGHDVTLAVRDPNETNRYQVDSSVRVESIDSILSDESKYIPDIAHFHVIWLPVMHKLCKWAKRNKVPVVWSPHGTLTPWAIKYHWWKKWPIWWLFQKRDLAYARLLHATAQSEVEDFRRMGLKNPACLAPLGVRIEDRVEHVERVEGEKVLLFVSRVQKKKGLVNLVNAWTVLPQEVKKGWKVRIVGPDQENHTAELVALCNERGVSQDFEFVGPKFGDELQREYAMADLFVLPTHSENFGSVVVEALAHGLPVITTKGAPWAEIETARCGWWIDIGVEPLISALQTALMLNDKERHEMGLRGRKLVKEKYTWAAVVKTMEQAYESVLSDAR